jgi:putative membrane protein
VKKLVAACALSLGIALGLSAPVQAQPWRGYYGYGPGMMWDWGWGGWFLGPVMMLVFWGAVIAAVVFAVRWLARAGAPDRPGRTSLDILKERFARGEIDKEEFELRRKILAEG